jgi:hypothetical protein
MTTTPAAAPVAPAPSAASPDAKGVNFSARLVDFWWIKIPAKLRGYSTLLMAAWSDGMYLTAWPRTAATLVVAVFFFGFIEGGTHWTFVGLNGYGLVSGVHAISFAEMFPLLLVAAFLGPLSANLGLMLVIGFALGDFFWFGVPYWPWDQHLLSFVPRTFYFRSSQLAAYLVFFLLAVWPVVATKFLVASAHRRFRESELWKTVMTVVVLALFVYEWTYFASMGTKWQWGCCDLESQLDVRYFHTITAPWLIAAAVIGVVTRQLLTLAGEKRDPKLVSRQHATGQPVVGSNSRMPAWLNALIGAFVMALLLLGYAGSLGRGAIVFIIVAAILLCRTYLLQRWSVWKTWSSRIGAYPTLARFILATLLTYVVCRLILMYPRFDARLGYSSLDFSPELAAILIGFVVLLVLLPNGPLSRDGRVASGSPEMRRIPVPSAAIQALVVIGLVLFSSKKALAALCHDPACCFGGDNGLASSATTAAIPGLGGIAGRPAKKDPCASQEQAMKDAQNLADSLKAEAHAYQSAVQADAANVKADQAEADSAYSTLQSLLNTLGDEITEAIQGWPSNPADFTNQQLQKMQSTYGSGPYAQQVAALVSAVQRLKGALAKQTNDTNNYNKTCDEYRDAYSAAAQATSAYWDCVISHGGVAPLGEPSPPSLAHPLGAPSAPKSQ